MCLMNPVLSRHEAGWKGWGGGSMCAGGMPRFLRKNRRVPGGSVAQM